ncbi:MAG: glycosyltransferase, partial [Nitrososphaeria archaeon]|nr:glycosyltransferase [Nitrososphaeria archaeon]NIQ34264.1 glycosyltransferase [Nitrososphaeria archaeon]
DSVSNQDYTGRIEHYVVVDGPRDRDIEGEFDGVKTIVREERGGPGAARNTAIHSIMDCDTQYLAFLDDDDWYRPNAISLLVESIGDYDAAYGDLNFKEWELKDGEKSLKSDKVRWSRDWRNRGDLKEGNFIPLPACLFQMQFFRDYGFFREDIGRCVDWELLARAEANGARFKHIPYIIGEAEWVWGKGTDNISTVNPDKNFPPTTWARIKTIIEGHYI